MQATMVRPSRFILIVGPAGSGKSTYVAQNFAQGGYTVVCPDAIREAITGDEADQSRNVEVFEEAYRVITEEISLGRDVVLDATNVRSDHRRTVAKIARDLGARAEAHVMQASLDDCLARNKARAQHGGREVPERVIRLQFEWFLISLSLIPREGFAKMILAEIKRCSRGGCDRPMYPGNFRGMCLECQATWSSRV